MKICGGFEKFFPTFHIAFYENERRRNENIVCECLSRYEPSNRPSISNQSFKNPVWFMKLSENCRIWYRVKTGEFAIIESIANFDDEEIEFANSP